MLANNKVNNSKTFSDNDIIELLSLKKHDKKSQILAKIKHLGLSELREQLIKYNIKILDSIKSDHNALSNTLLKVVCHRLNEIKYNKKHKKVKIIRRTTSNNNNSDISDEETTTSFDDDSTIGRLNFKQMNYDIMDDNKYDSHSHDEHVDTPRPDDSQFGINNTIESYTAAYNTYKSANNKTSHDSSNESMIANLSVPNNTNNNNGYYKYRYDSDDNSELFDV